MKNLNVTTYDNLKKIALLLEEDKISYHINSDYITINQEFGTLIINNLNQLCGNINFNYLINPLALKSFGGFPASNLNDFLIEESKDSDLISTLEVIGDKLNWNIHPKSSLAINDFNLKYSLVSEGNNQAYIIQLNFQKYDSKVYIVKDIDKIILMLENFSFDDILKKISLKTFNFIKNLAP